MRELGRRGPRALRPGRALLRLGDPGARRARARPTRGGRRPGSGARRPTPSGSACSSPRRSPAGRAPPSSSPRATRPRRRRRRRPRWTRPRAPARAPGRLLARPPRPRPRRGGRPDARDRRAARAEQEHGAAGSVRSRDEARRDLRRLGARAESRGPRAAGESGLPALSRREAEIAEMVCDRHTNREIAAALFLSEKTVEIARAPRLPQARRQLARGGRAPGRAGPARRGRRMRRQVQGVALMSGAARCGKVVPCPALSASAPSSPTTCSSCSRSRTP